MGKSLIFSLLLTFLLITFVGCKKDEPGIPGDDDFVGGDYFVATWGNDTLPGTKKEPWKTWQKAFETAGPGDTVYFRGGTWYPTTYAFANSITILAPTKIEGVYTGNIYGHDGTAENPVCFFAYPPDYEKRNFPILDCSKVNTDGHQYNTGIDIFGADYIHFKGLTVRNVKQTKVNGETAKVACGIGPYVCSNLTFENMTVSHIGGRGFSVSSTVGYFGITKDVTRWINCDVHDCADMLSVVPGNAADGWKCDGEVGGYFYFEGCRVWNCTDDGIDVSGSIIAVINNCWSFNQGIAGSVDGNGFKFGANRGDGAVIKDGVLTLGTLVPGPRRLVVNCIAAYNLRNGFYDLEYVPYYRNDSRIYNNISYHNGVGFDGSSNVDFPDFLSRYRNNIAYASTDKTPINTPYNVGIFGVYPESHNTWIANDPRPGSWPWFNESEELKVSDADFLSLNVAELQSNRKSDGSLPDINFLKFTDASEISKKSGFNVGMSNPAPIGVDWNFLKSGAIIDVAFIEGLED